VAPPVIAAPGRRGLPTRLRRLPLPGLSLGLILSAPALAQAQPVALPSQSDISRQQLPAAREPQERYDFTIQNPERAAVPRSVDEVEFAVTHIAVRGADSLDPAQVAALFAPLEGRSIRLDQLREATARLESLYRAQGYFLARVFIAPQQVRDGVLEVTVIEGRLAALSVNSPNPASERLGRLALAPVVSGRMPRLAAVETALERLNAVPGLSANGVLRPGERLGETEMVLQLAAPRPTVRASATNTASHELGPMAYSLSGSLSQPFGRPGSVDLFLAAAGKDMAELQTAGMRIASPINQGKAVLSLSGLVAHARPGGQIRTLEVRSDLVSLTASLGGALLRSGSATLSWETAFTWTANHVDALGRRLSEDRTSVVELRLTAQQRGWLGGDLLATVSLARGLGILGAAAASLPTASVGNFDPDFTRITWLVRRDQPLLAGLRAVGSLRGQYTTATLLSGQQTAFGGSDIGRAFDPSSLAGDRGIGVLGELQFSPRLASTWIKAAQAYGFVDAARVGYSRTVPGPAMPNALASIGAGLRADLFRHVEVDFQIAHAVRGMLLARQRPTRVNFAAAVHF